MCVSVCGLRPRSLQAAPGMPGMPPSGAHEATWKLSSLPNGRNLKPLPCLPGDSNVVSFWVSYGFLVRNQNTLRMHEAPGVWLSTRSVPATTTE